MATNMFETAPAGTPIEPTHSVRSYYRRQIYPATPSTGENHVAGRETQWKIPCHGFLSAAAAIELERRWASCDHVELRRCSTRSRKCG